MKQPNEVIRSFGSREEANQWAYRHGGKSRLYVFTENTIPTFTYWVCCEEVFEVVKRFPNSYQILSVYE